MALARASFINGGHAVEPVQISSPYVSNGGHLIRSGSSYGYPLAPGRSFSSVPSGSLIVRGGYGSPYSAYNGRSLSVGIPNYSGPVLPGYGARSISYSLSATPTYPSYSAAPILKNGGGYAAGYNSGFEGGYGNIQNYIQPQQPIGHASFNGLGNAYNGY